MHYDHMLFCSVSLLKCGQTELFARFVVVLGLIATNTLTCPLGSIVVISWWRGHVFCALSTPSPRAPGISWLPVLCVVAGAPHYYRSLAPRRPSPHSPTNPPPHSHCFNYQPKKIRMLTLLYVRCKTIFCGLCGNDNAVGHMVYYISVVLSNLGERITSGARCRCELVDKMKEYNQSTTVPGIIPGIIA